MFDRAKVLASKFKLDNLANTNYQSQLDRISKGKIACAQTRFFSDSNKEDLRKRHSYSKKLKRNK